MLKNNIRILVQAIHETAEQFAKRVELKTNSLLDEFSHKIVDKTITFSSSSDGRQTANIQFFTNEKIETKQVLFDKETLINAYNRFKEKNLFSTPSADYLFNFLLKQNVEDCVKQNNKMSIKNQLATEHSFDGEYASEEAYSSFKEGFEKAIELVQEIILQGDNFSEKISALLKE